MSRKQWANLVICLVIFGVVAYGIRFAAEADGPVELLNPEPALSKRVEALGDEVRLVEENFEINQVSKEVTASFELANQSSAAIRDIEISCDYNSGDQLLMGRGRWIVYETLEPGSTERYQVQARRYISHRVRPEMINCTIVDLGLAGIRVAGHQSGRTH